MAWIEVTPDEVRAARIETWALQSAGLQPDPIVFAIATAAPHSEKWVALQDTRERHLRGATPESTNDISKAMDRGLMAVLEDRRDAFIPRAGEPAPRVGHAPEPQRREDLQPVAASRGWLSRLFGR